MRVDGKVNASKNTETTETPNIHNVTILDGSGSMSGEKYINACEGIKLDFKTCKQQNFSTFTFVEFNDINSITTHYFMSPFEEINLKFNGPHGFTPLYRTIGETLEKLLKKVSKGDSVLVKVFTDGKEEGGDKSKYTNLEVLSNLIRKCESQGFTITFIGTEHDTNFIIRNLGLDKSNTLVHDNTGEGVKMSFQTQASATVQYRKSLDEGEDVSVGFYSKVLNN